MSTNNKVTPLENEGFRSPRWFARHPMVGIVMVIVGVVMFSALAINLVANGPLIPWDNRIAERWPAWALGQPGYVKAILLSGFYIGKEVLLVTAVVLLCYFLIKRYWLEITTLVFAIAGASLVFSILIILFGRTRPATEIWIPVALNSFPSGHAISAVAFYGWLTYISLPKIKSAFGKTVVVILAVILIVFISLSRVVTGGHYLTDVLAGWSIGIAWSGGMFTLLETISERRRLKNEKEK